MSSTILKLLKIGKRENMEKLLYNGEVFMRHVENFRNEDIGDFLRGDFAEGLAWTPFLNFRIPSLEKHGLNIRNVKINEDLDFSHIYSMFMLDEDFWYNKKEISDKLLEFGDTALIINPKEFVEKVKSVYKVQGGIVNYYKEPLIPQRISEFSKRKGFEFQNEYRFIANSKTNDPVKILIGSLEDIAILVPTKSLITMKFVIK